MSTPNVGHVEACSPVLARGARRGQGRFGSVSRSFQVGLACRHEMMDTSAELLQKSPVSMQDEPGRTKETGDYIVRVGAVTVFCSSSQVEALDRYVEALRQHPHEAVRFVAPRTPDLGPVVRGRALARASGRER